MVTKVVEIIDTHTHVEPWFMDIGATKPEPGMFDNLFADCPHKGRLCVSSTGRNPVLAGEGNVAAVRKLAELLKPSPDKFIGSIMVDPNDLEGALEAIEIGVKELGMQMVGELVQYIHGWRSDGPEAIPVVQKAIDLDVPLMFHSASAEHAEGVAHIAEKFPRARIIIAHASGGRDWRRGVELIKNLQNVTVEIMRGNDKPLEVLLKEVGPSRITYGTDFGVHQGPELRYTAGNWLLEALEKLKLKDSEIEKICSGNAKELMKLEG